MIDVILLETIYTLLVLIPSIVLFIRTRQIYRFSTYRGLHYFSLAFLSLAIGFTFRYVVMLAKLFQGNILTISTFNEWTMLMEFFLVLPGFLLLYSLIWRKLESKHYGNPSRLPISVILILAVLVAMIDWLLQAFTIMYASQILVFLFASIISMRTYLKNKNKFKQLYTISMILFLIVWIINLIAQYSIDVIPYIRIYAYAFTIIGWMILLLITLKLTRDFT